MQDASFERIHSLRFSVCTTCFLKPDTSQTFQVFYRYCDRAVQLRAEIGRPALSAGVIAMVSASNLYVAREVKRHTWT